MWLRYEINKLTRSFLVNTEEKVKKIAISWRKMRKDEYINSLMTKIQEEALEVAESKSREELVEEIADVYEVIDAILSEKQISKEEIIAAQVQKNKIKGGFENRIFCNYIQLHSERKYTENVEKWRSCGKYIVHETFHKHIVDFIIYDAKTNKIYIQKRSETRKSHPNCWELPRGTLEINENMQECVERELKEKLNLKLSKNHGIIYESSYIENDENHAYTVFWIEAENCSDLKLEEGKATEYQWINHNQIEILNINSKNGEKNPIYKAVDAFFNNLTP